VRVDAHQHDILDAVLHTVIVNLLAAVADAVVADDVQPLVLLAELLHGRADHGVIAGTLGDVHGQRRLALGVAVAPGDGHRSLGRLGLLHPFAVRRLFVDVHAAAGRVNDHDGVVARRGDDLVHPRHHHLDALGGALAVV